MQPRLATTFTLVTVGFVRFDVRIFLPHTHFSWL